MSWSGNQTWHDSPRKVCDELAGLLAVATFSASCLLLAQPYGRSLWLRGLLLHDNSLPVCNQLPGLGLHLQVLSENVKLLSDGFRICPAPFMAGRFNVYSQIRGIVTEF